MHIYAYFILLHIYHVFSDARLFVSQPARIDDEDPGYEDDDWSHREHRTGESLPLRTDRWFRTPPEEVIDGQEIAGIGCQIWERARVRSLMTHRLSGGGES